MPQARRHQTFDNIYALGRLHDFFARHGVRPDLRDHLSGRSAIRESAEVLGALLRARRLRNRRAPSRLGNAAVRAGRRRPASRTRCRCRSAQFDAQLASLTEAIRGATSACSPCRIDPAGSVSRRRTCRRSNSSGYLVDSCVAPLFYEAHKRRTGLRRRTARALLSWPTTTRRVQARASCSSCRSLRR